MALTSTYSAGTVTVSADGTAVTGAGTQWIAGGVRPGDLFATKGLSVSIASVISATSITLAEPWTGGALSGAAYEIRYTPDATRVLASSREMLEVFEGADLRKSNFSAVRAPLPADDESQGYAVGSRWLWQGQEWVYAGSGRWLARDEAITPEMFGAVRDVADPNNASAFEAAVQAAITTGRTLRGTGRLAFTRPLVIDTSGRLALDLSAAVLDFSAVPANTNINLGDLIRFSGAKGSAVPLTANSASWVTQANGAASKLTVASTAGFAVGDLVFVEDDSLIHSDDTARRGELARVSRVTATEIHLHDSLKLAYTTTNAARVSRISTVKVTGNFGTIVGGGVGGAHKGIVLRYADSARIVANIEAADSVGIELQYCYAAAVNATVRDATLTPATGIGKTGYGVLVGAGCRHCDVDIIATNCSHAVAGGGLHAAMQIKIRGHAIGCGLGYPAWDAHEECFDWTFDVSSTGGNGGLTFRGQDASIRYRGRECQSGVAITNNGYSFTQGRIHLDLIDVDNHGSVQIGRTGDQPITEISFGVIRANRVRFGVVHFVNALSVRGDTIDARGFRSYPGDNDTSFRLLHFQSVGEADIGRVVLKEGKFTGLASDGGRLRIAYADIGVMPRPTDLTGLAELVIGAGTIVSTGQQRPPLNITQCNNVRCGADLIGDPAQTTQDGVRGIDCNGVRLIGARVIAGRHAAYISGASSKLMGVGCDFSGVTGAIKLNAPDTPVNVGNIA